jgi:hypothetical protein
MFIIGEASIEDRLGGEKFACDPDACRGACCTLEGGRGAPLDDRELEEIRKAFPAVRRYLPPKSLEAIAKSGLFEGVPGDYATPCVESRECVYAFFDSGIARCSFERAFLAGETQWPKPVSCHLFPIRVRRFGLEFLHYEEIEECAPGRRRGTEEDIPLAEFLKEPLVRRFGTAWYRTFAAECLARRRQSTPACQTQAQ